jgi:hypothetical protein
MEVHTMTNTEELHDLIEDLAGNLEDAADMLEKILQVVAPSVQSNDIRVYRKLVERAQTMLADMSHS